MKANFLVFSEIFYPHGSGAELATYLYVNLLKDAGHNVIVLTNRYNGETAVSKSKNLTIHRVSLFRQNESLKYSASKRLDVLLSSSISKLFEQSDVVYIPRFWYSAIPIAKLHRKPVVVHLHDYIALCPLSNAYDASKGTFCNRKNLLCPPRCVYAYGNSFDVAFKDIFLSTILNSTVGCCFGRLAMLSDALICVSKAQRDILVKSRRSLFDKCSVVYNPFPKNPLIELSGDDFGYFGGSDYLKGFHTLYKSMYRINQPKIRIRVHATKFGKKNEKLHASLSKLGFSLYTRLGQNEYEKIYRQIKSVLIPSVWHEPWPYTVIEAIVNGRFIIASRVGGIPEQLEGCKNALLCEPNNPEQLINALEFAENLTREQIIEVGHQSRQTYLKKFDNEISLTNFINVCENLI